MGVKLEDLVQEVQLIVDNQPHAMQILFLIKLIYLLVEEEVQYIIKMVCLCREMAHLNFSISITAKVNEIQ